MRLFSTLMSSSVSMNVGKAYFQRLHCKFLETKAISQLELLSGRRVMLARACNRSEVSGRDVRISFSWGRGVVSKLGRLTDQSMIH